MKCFFFTPKLNKISDCWRLLGLIHLTLNIITIWTLMITLPNHNKLIILKWLYMWKSLCIFSLSIYSKFTSYFVSIFIKYLTRYIIISTTAPFITISNNHKSSKFKSCYLGLKLTILYTSINSNLVSLFISILSINLSINSTTWSILIFTMPYDYKTPIL